MTSNINASDTIEAHTQYAIGRATYEKELAHIDVVASGMAARAQTASTTIEPSQFDVVCNIYKKEIVNSELPPGYATQLMRQISSLGSIAALESSLEVVINYSKAQDAPTAEKLVTLLKRVQIDVKNGLFTQSKMAGVLKG